MNRIILSALAVSAFTVPALAEPQTVTLCTGAKEGVYAAAGETIANFAGSDITIQVVYTDGTFGNMSRLLAPDGCDAMIGQPDGPVYLKRTKPSDAARISRVMKLHREYLQVLCSKESGIDDLSDLKETDTVAIGPPGSGSWLIWQNFIEQDDFYAKIKTTTDAKLIALTSVASNETQCMVVPSGVPNGVVSEADANFGDSVEFVSATDKDFNDAEDIDGKALYEFVKVPTKQYPVTFNRYWSAPKTVSWNASLYVNKAKMTADKLNSLLKAATRARSTILANYGQ